MTRRPAELTGRVFDLLVVGGGIHGVAAAYDAAQRGLDVALIDRDDLGSGSSFNHLKTVHGGLRSLQSANVARFREGVLERRTLARIAPHLVEPLGFLLPTLPAKVTRSRSALFAAFLIDAALGADRNRGVPPHLVLPRGRVLSRAQAVAACPALGTTSATGAALWFDYQMPRTDRLTLAFAEAASRHGVRVATYVAADAAIVERSDVLGVRARDVASGQVFVIRARVTLNAAGAGAGPLAATFGAGEMPPLQKALNVVTARPSTGLAIGAPLGTGTLFLVPWQGRMMIGTWHDDRPCEPTASQVTLDELTRFLADANAAFPWLGLGLEEVTMVHRGLVPASPAGDGRLRMRTHSAVIDHAARGIHGAVSIVGVKYTTGRAVAQRAVDLVVKKLGRHASPARTADTPLPGATSEVGAIAARIEASLPPHGDDVAAHLACSYGAEASGVLRVAATRPDLLDRVVPHLPVLRAEVVHAVRRELATTLTDVVARRVQIGAAGHPGDAVAQKVAEVMRDECGWDDERTAREVRDLRRFYLPVTRALDGQ